MNLWLRQYESDLCERKEDFVEEFSRDTRKSAWQIEVIVISLNKVEVESAKAHATPLRILTLKFDYIESRFKNVYFRQIDTGTNPKQPRRVSSSIFHTSHESERNQGWISVLHGSDILWPSECWTHQAWKNAVSARLNMRQIVKIYLYVISCIFLQTLLKNSRRISSK